jgi:hypothetical protein
MSLTPLKTENTDTASLCLGRRGVVFYVVLATVTIMGIFILFYQNFSRQLAFSSFYHVNREKIRYLTDILIDSAFSTVQIATRDPSHPLNQKIVEQMRSSALDSSPFPLEASLFEQNKRSEERRVGKEC